MDGSLYIYILYIYILVKENFYPDAPVGTGRFSPIYIWRFLFF